jgi:hypothetical protein
MTFAVSGLFAPAHRNDAHLHKPVKHGYEINAKTKKGHGFFFQRHKPMSLAGFAKKAGPPGVQKSMLKTTVNGINGNMKPIEKSFGFHANNALAIRTSETTQIKTLRKTIKINQNISMTPYPYRTASRAFVRLDPIKFSPLIINVLEFCTNGKYHCPHLFLGRQNRPGFRGDRSA